MALVDFHTHTNFSDGCDSPTELVRLAVSEGITTLAVTDHDGFGGYAEAMKAGEELGVKIIAGSEISTECRGKSIHIVALGFSPDDEKFLGWIKEQYEWRTQSVLSKMALIAEISGLAIDLEDFKKSGPYFNGHKSIEYLVAKGICADDKEALGYWLKAKDADRGEKALATEEVIERIARAGAVPVLAHPLAPKISLKKISIDELEQEKIIAGFKEAGLAAIECRQSGHNPTDVALARRWADKFGLLVSGGSDWHGQISVLGENIRKFIPYYPERIGEVAQPGGEVAPLLARLGL